MSYVKIRPRRDTAAGWAYHNPVLSEGEEGWEVPETGVGTGLINIKQGDGVTAWNDLPYAVLGKQMADRLTEIEDTVGEALAIPIVYNSESNPPTFGSKPFLWIS